MSLGSRSSPSCRSCSWRAARQWTSLCRKLGRCHFLKCQLTALRLSPGEGGKDGTLGKMQSPVALELLELLARSHIPQPDAVVVLILTPAARSEHGAVERESDVVDLGTVLVL